MKIIHKKISELIEYKNNPRVNDHAVERTANAIKEFGFRVPILIKSDGSVVDGHLRIKAARVLNMLNNKQCQNMFCYQPAVRSYVHPKTGRMQYRCELCFRKQSRGMINGR